MATTLFTGSEHAIIYSKFRPSPPQYFIDLIMKYLQNKVHGPLKHAIDIGCGSGQSTVVFAPHFEKVTGLDVSEAQIESARRNRSLSNIEYIVSDCSTLPFPDSSVELVTSCEAIHYFNLSELFAEVKRILVPNGVVAVYGYWTFLPQTQNEECNKKIAKLIDVDFYEVELRKYWHKGRKIAKNHYRDIDLPFKDVQRFTYVHKTESNLADYLGFLSSSSGYQKFFQEDTEKAKKLLKDVGKQLATLLGEQNKPQEEVSFPLHADFFMLIGCN